jgi:ferric-dicitrate binding protein FerR (iron transport regulator)
MENQITDMDRVILRQLDGSASPDERKMLLQWLMASEANRADYCEVRDLWLSCDAALRESDETGEALNRLRRRVRNTRSFAIKKAWSRRWVGRWYYYVAVALLVLLIANYRLAIHPFVTVEKVFVVQNQLITAKSSKGRFVLPDGSVVWLNAESKLTYPETFEGAERQVQLEGEGYFEIAENREQPFIVRSGNLEVEALGTTFDIARYPFRNKTEIVLLDGSVKVTSQTFREDIILSPDQMLELTGDGVYRVHKTNARMHIGWIKDKLVFDNDRLSDIIHSLEGWYCLDIKCPQAFADKTRMSFTVKAENIQEILKAMSLVIPVTWSVSDSVATIIPKKQHTNR